MDIRSRYTLHTAENVNLDVELAGVANRVFAYLVDALIMLIVFIVAMLAVSSLSRVNKEAGDTLAPFLTFGIPFGYHFFLEWLWNGKTLGKAMFNIRVVRNNGQAIGFWESFGRNLMRIIDVFLSGAGILVMILSKQEKRLGDYLVGTIVVSNESDNPMTGPITGAARPLAHKQQAEAPGAISPTPEEYHMLKSYLQRKKVLFPSAQAHLESELRGHFKERYNLAEETVKDPAFLETLYNAFRR